MYVIYTYTHIYVYSRSKCYNICYKIILKFIKFENYAHVYIITFDCM